MASEFMGLRRWLYAALTAALVAETDVCGGATRGCCVIRRGVMATARVVVVSESAPSVGVVRLLW